LQDEVNQSMNKEKKRSSGKKVIKEYFIAKQAIEKNQATNEEKAIEQTSAKENPSKEPSYTKEVIEEPLNKENKDTDEPSAKKKNASPEENVAEKISVENQATTETPTQATMEENPSAQENVSEAPLVVADEEDKEKSTTINKKNTTKEVGEVVDHQAEQEPCVQAPIVRRRRGRPPKNGIARVTLKVNCHTMQILIV